MSRWFILLPVVALMFATVITGCASRYVAPAPPPAAAATVGLLAERGASIFARRCASCHGNKGEGVTAPALIGSATHLDHFDTARDLHEYIKVTMPFDKPGSLSQEECNELTCFLMAENELVTHETVFDLNNIRLEHLEEENGAHR